MLINSLVAGIFKAISYFIYVKRNLIFSYFCAYLRYYYGITKSKYKKQKSLTRILSY